MPPLLRVSGLQRRYGDRLIGPLDFTVEAGELAVITGPSGSGKSTVLDMIYGTRTASSGSVFLTVDGQSVDLLAIPVAALIKCRDQYLAYGTQFFQGVASQTGFDLALTVRGADSDDVTRIFSALRLPEAIWSRPVSTYSGGERQRLNIALAALRRPRVLLLDEPLASLDTDLHRSVWDLTKELLKSGTAVLAALHDCCDLDVPARHLMNLTPKL